MPHINELIDFCVETFVVFEDRVLLRYHDKYEKWLSVGGHIELDENPNEAAVREVKEEVGLDAELFDDQLPFEKKEVGYEELIPPVFMNIHNITDTHQHIGMIYFAKTDSDEVIEPEREKSGGWKWMTKDDIESADHIDDEIKFYALQALDKLSSVA
ncbi:NUDIX hydrolase [Patescibacteria group bacterium]